MVNLYVEGSSIFKDTITLDNSPGQAQLILQSGTGQSAFIFLGDDAGQWKFNTFGPSADLQLRQNGNAINRNFEVQMGTGQMQMTSGGSNFSWSAALNDYRSQNVTLTYSGPFTASQTAACRLTKVGSMVTATFIGLSSATTVAAQTITATAIPAVFFPAQNTTALIAIQDNSVSDTRIIDVSAGVLNIWRFWKNLYRDTANGRILIPFFYLAV